MSSSSPGFDPAARAKARRRRSTLHTKYDENENTMDFELHENIKSIRGERRALLQERQELEERLEKVRKEAAELEEKKALKSPRPPPPPFPSSNEGFNESVHHAPSSSSVSSGGGGKVNRSLADSSREEFSNPFQVGADDESFDEVFERAMQLKSNSSMRVTELKDRIEVMGQERQFIDKPPDTKVWRELQERLEDRSRGENRGLVNMEKVTQYIESGHEVDEIRDRELFTRTIEQLAKQIRNEILDEVVVIFARNISKFMSHAANAASKELNNIVFKALMGGTGSANPQLLGEREKKEKKSMFGVPIKTDSPTYIGETGLPQLLAGLLSEEFNAAAAAAAEMLPNNGPATHSLAPRSMRFSQVIANKSNPTPAPQTMPRRRVEKRDSLLESVSRFTDEDVNLAPLYELEANFWQGVRISPIREESLIPAFGGALKVCCVRLFPKPKRKQSDLVLGFIDGRFTITMLPWKFQRKAVTTAVSKALSSSADRAPLTDMREGSGGLIVSLDEKGIIRVYTLVTNDGFGGSKNFFPIDVTSFAPVTPGCISVLKPTNFIFPMPGVLSTFFSAEKKKSVGDPSASTMMPSLAISSMAEPSNKQQKLLKTLYETVYMDKAALKRVTPKCICFHPSVTASGRQNSLMVGLAGGQIVKVNLDCEAPQLEAPVVFPSTPFVDFEFLNPTGAPEGLLLASGDKSKRGNRVSRELFHYHKCSVILLDVVKGHGDTLISMDSSGLVALWRYVAEQFTGHYRFRPSDSCKLDLSWLMFDVVGESQVVDAPNQDLQDKLIPSESTEDTELSMETFQPIKVVEEDGTHKLLVYKKMDVATKSVKRTGRGEVLAEETVRAGVAQDPRASKLRRGESFLFDGRALATDVTAFERKSGNFQPEATMSSVSSAGDRGEEAETLSHLNGSVGSTGTHRSTDSRKKEKASEPAALAGSASNSSIGAASSKSSASQKYLGGACIWEAQEVRATPKSATLFGVKMSPDGLDTVILVLFSKSVTEARTQEETDTGAFLRIDAKSMELKPPFPIFNIIPGDKILDFEVGPIMKETLTRNVFVCTANAGLRSFSLTTGKEIEDSCFPFQASVPKSEKAKSKSPFVHSLFEMCPSQRFFVCKADKAMNTKSLLVYRFEDSGVRDDGLSLHEQRSEAQKCIPFAQLKVLMDFCVPTTERVIHNEVDQARVLSEELYEEYMIRVVEAEELCDALVEDILDGMDTAIDERQKAIQSNKDRYKLVSETYGFDKFGVVSPTEWPTGEERGQVRRFGSNEREKMEKELAELLGEALETIETRESGGGAGADTGRGKNGMNKEYEVTR